jgi:excinuclease ABC subunit A
LSGGEAQRIKLATELQTIQMGSTLYILDEPATGLHSVCDRVIDMGPGAGDEGGKIVGFGQPENIMNLKESKTAVFLKRKLKE